ncbi:hypothetical protein ACFQZS_14090 [Mucilaginibacter calamicampi]|uniref:Uncharacterized protein n=2 Tax=Mucilaginibacter calamicampi TaxID=1302352 RepID=A0ABW2Z3E3_9SPHI
MPEFYLRTESIKSDDILSLSVINNYDKDIITALKSSEPCLIEGSRGTGKSFLMRVAELEIERSDVSSISVYVSFNISSLVDTEDPLQFYHWMLAKSLKALINKLKKRGIVLSSYSVSLLSNDEHNEYDGVDEDLKSIVSAFENSYKGKINIPTHSLPDIEDVKEAIETICIEHKLKRIYFFFDEAAHVFRPDQQRQFFSLFKDLRSPYITCNAAIYPGVTYFGKSFEPTHDCIYKRLDRNIKDAGYIDYFKDIVLKQSDDVTKKAIKEQGGLFKVLALSSGGNPRMLLRTIQDLERFNTQSVNQLIKQFYRSQIWIEHTELGDKYKGHKQLIDWGRDFLENIAISAIEKYNTNRKDKNKEESTIYFWVHKDSPATVKEALRLLTYTGIIRKLDSGVRASRGELGTRYEVKYGCLIALQSSPNNESDDFFNTLSIKKFPEFGKNHSSYLTISNLKNTIEDINTFRESLSNMLQKPISVLKLLTSWQKSKLNHAKIFNLEQLYSCTETELIAKIYNVGPVRARLMKNAATAELLEYLSG